MTLHDRVAVITGAGGGIGRAMALRFSQEGARVVIAELDPATAAETARQVAEQGGQALTVAVDVGDAASVARLFATIDEAAWPVDILVNNAGAVEQGLKPIDEVEDERWHSMIRVHLDGTFFCTREALRRMRPRKQGAIVNVGSVAGLNGLPGAAAYTAAKGGIIALTKGVSQEVAPLGIRVNCIAPGWINTRMLDSLPERWRPGMIKHTPLARLGEPDEVAAVALFLASEQSSFITGQIISPNGGMYRW